MGMTYEELTEYGKMRRPGACGPYSMFVFESLIIVAYFMQIYSLSIFDGIFVYCLIYRFIRLADKWSHLHSPDQVC
jgi:hypothetical protein